MNEVAPVEHSHTSIEKISTRASLWAVGATILIVFLFSALAYVQEKNATYQSELKRLGMTINGIARALAAEELTGDDKSIAALESVLQSRFELSRIEIVPLIPAPQRTGWFRGILPPSEAKWTEKLPGISPSKYVVIAASSDSGDSLSGLIGSILVCIPLVLFGVITTLKIQRDLRRSIVVPVQKLAKDPEKWSAEGPWVAQEAITLHKLLLNYIRERDAERDTAEQLKIQASIGQIASQVAHDIRSPLAALDMVSNHLSQLPEEKRIIVRSALSRIRDIANGLLEKQRQSNRKPNDTRERTLSAGQSVELLSSLIDSLVTEKRMQYRLEAALEIEAPLALRSYGLFAEVNSTEFKRVLSALINAMVEASERKGRVTVELEARGEKILIAIEHTNPTSSPHYIGGNTSSVIPIRPHSMDYQEAKTCIIAWKGRLELKTDGGTNTLEIEIPRAHVPAWFVPELILTPGMVIAILDDDTSIHQIWQGRFDSLRLKERDIETAHLSMVDAFLKWQGEQTLLGKKIIYLIDYELIGSQKNGLELIQSLGIQRQSILVTSRFEERPIRQACESEEVRLIPKSLAGFVPVRVHQPSEQVDAILIDDDELVRNLWRDAAVSLGKRVRTFSTSNEFLRMATSFPIEVPLYVDFNLGENVANGEQIAQMASEIGFREVWLTTGEDPESRNPVPWIRGIRGKEPPFEA